jgi:hypothetical protein
MDKNLPIIHKLEDTLHYPTKFTADLPPNQNPKFLRGVIPEGRIFMVSKKGWAQLPGFGRKHPEQATPLKSEHPGLVVKDARPSLPVIEVLPGTSNKPRDGAASFCPSDEPIPATKGKTVKRGYFLLSEWRTVRRNTKAIRRHHADLTSSDLLRLKQAMTRVHGELWTTTSPHAGPR